MKKILIIGIPSDRVITAFSSFLKKHDYNFIFVNLSFLGKNIFFSNENITYFEEIIHYTEFTGVYNRIVSADWNIKVMDAYYQQLEILNFLLDCTMTNVINTPTSASSNNSKPYQLSRASEVGFKIPNSTILANTQCPNFDVPTIYKSVSGIRSIVTETIPEDLEREITCPVLFQDKIIGSNLRVHIIDNAVFALKITSDEIDYRYTESPNKYELIKLPADIENKCLELSKYLNLRFTGLDLIVDDRGDYYFLEANSSPAFTHFEEYMEQKDISKALATALCTGDY